MWQTTWWSMIRDVDPLLGLSLVLAIAALIAILSRSYTAAVMAGVIALLALAFRAVGGDGGDFRWAFLLAVLPALLVVDQGAYMLTVRRQQFPSHGELRFGKWPGSRDTAKGEQQLWEQYLAARDAYFSVEALALRYLVPAIALTVVAFTAALVLCGRLACCGGLSPQLAAAGWLGLAGSYVFVLLHLGQRALRRDITGGAAWWCGATLALGPVFAAVLSMVIKSGGTAPPVGGAAPAAGGGVELTQTVLYFFAGLAPRYVAGWIQDTVKRRLGPAEALTRRRAIPLALVRGILPDTELRLEEEGILDAATLAMSDPLRLMRATNFDKRQILAWIDEAILISTLETYWEALEQQGITGAIDLAWLAPSNQDNDQPIKDLAATSKVPAETLTQTAERLLEDAQVLIVWSLYQTASESNTHPPSGSDSEGSESDK